MFGVDDKDTVAVMALKGVAAVLLGGSVETLQVEDKVFREFETVVGVDNDDIEEACDEDNGSEDGTRVVDDVGKGGDISSKEAVRLLVKVTAVVIHTGAEKVVVEDGKDEDDAEDIDNEDGDEDDIDDSVMVAVVEDAEFCTEVSRPRTALPAEQDEALPRSLILEEVVDNVVVEAVALLEDDFGSESFLLLLPFPFLAGVFLGVGLDGVAGGCKNETSDSSSSTKS